MFKEKEINMPIASTNTTSGLVSALQLVDKTSSEIFATVRNDTSELEIQRITYSQIRQHEDIWLWLSASSKSPSTTSDTHQLLP